MAVNLRIVSLTVTTAAAEQTYRFDRPATVITGHHPVMKPADLLEYAAFNPEFAATMQAAKKAGKTVDEMAASWKIPAKYQGYAAPAEVRLKSNIQIVFDETK